MYRDAFDFHKERARHLSNDDAFWNATVDRMTELSAKYSANPFMMEMLTVVYGELERQALAEGGAARC